MRRLVDHFVAWRVLLPGLVCAAGLAIAAVRMTPPAPTVAIRCVTMVAVLLFAKLLAWVAQTGHTFAREQRLLTFVMFAAIVLGWFGFREDIAEAAFDYQVAAQRAQLAVAARTLAFQIEGFLVVRGRAAPHVPQPATWDADEAAILQFEAATVTEYEARFGGQVRAAHDLLTLRGLRNRDLDAFYRAPAGAFQMHIVAARLAFLADKLEQPRPR
jgi:hypothetical protein